MHSLTREKKPHGFSFQAQFCAHPTVCVHPGLGAEHNERTKDDVGGWVGGWGYLQNTLYLSESPEGILREAGEGRSFAKSGLSRLREEI